MFVSQVQGVPVEGDALAAALGVGGVDPEEEGVTRRQPSCDEFRTLGRDVDDQLKRTTKLNGLLNMMSFFMDHQDTGLIYGKLLVQST